MKTAVWMLWLARICQLCHAQNETEWQPPAKRPDVVLSLSQEELGKRWAAALTQIEVWKTDNAGWPPRGVLISDAYDGPGRDAGMRDGDVVTALDGHAPPHHSVFLRALIPQKLTYFSAEAKEERTITVQPGRLAINLSRYPRNVPLDFEKTPRDPRWNAALDVLSYYADRDPPLAEAALKRALEAGLPPSSATDRAAARVAFNQGRLEDALNYGWLAMQADPADLTSRSIVYASALNTYRPAMALAVIKETGLFIQNASFLERRMPAILRQRPETTPSDRARMLARDSINLRAVPFPPHRRDGEQFQRIEDVVADDRFDISVPTHQYDSFTFGPAVGNLSIEFTFTARNSDQRITGASKHFTFGVMDINAPDSAEHARFGGPAGLYGLVCTAQGLFVHHPQSELTTHLFHTAPFDGAAAGRENTFRMVVMNGAAEMFWNEQRVFYGPLLADNAEWVASFRAIGMTVNVKNVRVYELLSKEEWAARLQKTINQPFARKYTPLHYAVRYESPEDVARLIPFKPDFRLRNEAGETPLQLAARLGKKEVARTLVENGAALDLVSAATLGWRDDVARILKETPDLKIDATTCHWTALHGAVLSGDIDVAKLLIEAGADVESKATRDYRGQTPLMWAVRHDQRGMAALLLDAGANVNRGDTANRTALLYAEEAQNIRMIEFLKSKNATKTADDSVLPPAPPKQEF